MSFPRCGTQQLAYNASQPVELPYSLLAPRLPFLTCKVYLASTHQARSNESLQGGWEADETVEAAAARETVEEAGVRGVLEVTVVMSLTSPECAYCHCCLLDQHLFTHVPAACL